ncbi:hypothetical protein FIU86_11680 [Roseovarius sp. THAF9]|uniref:hypothetical protein n=1 Tax=Roseovarius sp. THAF9 TaxID=2587847 RepID=UPI001268FC99|nr:hypothetical protein [Roseovarius sp. THAF9]QFT93503.1 hypothetical protein FIU86_11680 [Roseovarius sp. THAF9]
MIDQTYLVTKMPESEGMHFVHADTCQVLPDIEMETLGTYDGCAQAMEKAAQSYDPLNACALCCPDCFIKSDETEA